VILAVDIDGTITDERRRLHPEVLRVLQSLEAEIILASGNTLCFTLAAATLIGTSGKVIAENGGVIQLGYDIEKILLASKDLPERALRYLSNLFPSIQPLDHEYRFSEVEGISRAGARGHGFCIPYKAQRCQQRQSS